jgi:hypothetical protein
LRIIASKKHPLQLSGKYAKIPLTLENKLRDIFPNEDEYQFIKSELIKSPTGMFDEFIDLFMDLKEENEKLNQKELKNLEYIDEE